MNDCSYCHCGDSLWRGVDLDEIYITQNKLIALTDGYVNEMIINFCPICGRELKGGAECE